MATTTNKKNTGLRVAGTLCGLIAIVHLIRLALGVEITAGGRVIPLWMSAIAMIAAGGLAVWLIRLSH